MELSSPCFELTLVITLCLFLIDEVPKIRKCQNYVVFAVLPEDPAGKNESC